MIKLHPGVFPGANMRHNSVHFSDCRAFPKVRIGQNGNKHVSVGLIHPKGPRIIKIKEFKLLRAGPQGSLIGDAATGLGHRSTLVELCVKICTY